MSGHILQRAVPRDIVARVSLAVGVIVVAACIGIVSARSTEYAILAAFAVLAVGIIVTEPLLLVAMAVPATLLLTRVGGILSVSDVVLALAMAVSIFLIRPQGLRSLQPLMWAGITYLAAALPTIILNPYAANIVEWAHEVVLVLGSMVVGYTVARQGRAQFVVGLYVYACAVLAVIASFTGAAMLATEGTFGPVYLPDLHKNTIGGMLGVAIVIVYGRPAWFRLPIRRAWILMGILAVGVLASQSRQAMIGTLVGLLVVSLRRSPETGKFPKLVWLAAAPVLFLVVTMVNEQLASGDQFNSTYQRLDWYAQTLTIWATSPVFGVGLRWWYTDRFSAAFQPPNAEFEALSSVGVVGLVGFLLMFLVALWLLWRLDPAYGTVGAAVVLTRFTQAQFDLYWVAGQAALLWIIAGICYGAVEYNRKHLADPVVVGETPAHEKRPRSRVAGRRSRATVAR